MGSDGTFEQLLKTERLISDHLSRLSLDPNAIRTSILDTVRGADAQCPSAVRGGTAEGSSTAITKKCAKNGVQ
jgi:hypothetical protein